MLNNQQFKIIKKPTVIKKSLKERDISSVTMYPWRSFSANFTKLFIPNNKFGKILLNLLFGLEDRFPGFFVKYFQYQMIVLIKKA